MLDTAICAIQGFGRITFDHLRCITRGEQAVRLGPDDHTSRSYNVLRVMLGTYGVLLCDETHVLGTQHSSSWCIQYVANQRNGWLSRVDRTVVAHMGE